jgi:hypothetical protein
LSVVPRIHPTEERRGKVSFRTPNPTGTESHDMHIYRLFCEDNE